MVVSPGTFDDGYERVCQRKAHATYPSSWDTESQGVLAWVSFPKYSLNNRGSNLHHLLGATEVTVMVICVAPDI